MFANCWEVKKCGREPRGQKVAELGICAATSNTSVHGCNGGTNAGRICWAIAGTLCGGKVQGTSAQKVMTCMSCEFYGQVRREQGHAFLIMPTAARVR